MTPISPIRNVLPLALALALPMAPAFATTAIETQFENKAAVAPHQSLPLAGKAVTVHYVHLKNDYGGPLEKQAEQLLNKPNLAKCAEEHKKLGWPAKAPTEFPDQLARVHLYEYWAKNRMISYKLSYYASMGKDCGLIETTTLEATLKSMKGQCDIDFTHKTATGECDANGHADAPPEPPKPSEAEMEAQIKAMEANPVMKQSAAALRNMPKIKYGAKRTIAGHTCQMSEWSGSKTCMSKEGSFIPSTGGGGVQLYGEFFTGSFTASESKFDISANAAIFTPYLDGSFTINGKKGK